MHGGAALQHIPLSTPGWQGLNTESAASLLGPEWATELKNCVIDDANRLAARKGWDPDRWFDNVEQAMLLLSEPRYYRKARHGYVRGIEPVTYVRDIRELYNAYRSMLRS